jgi:hypothetical protein
MDIRRLLQRIALAVPRFSRCRAEENAAALTAAQIAERVAELYAACASYSDTGRYRSLHESGAFTTAFVRPDHFRFEYEGYVWDSIPDRSLIWRDGREGTDGGLAEFRSRFAIDEHEGVGDREEEEEVTRLPLGEYLPRTMQRAIPALLLPGEVRDDAFDVPGGLRRLADARLDGQEGQECHRIAGETRTLWIDRRTFLVRRITEPGAVTSFEPILNGEVTEEMLRPGW